MGCSPLEPSAGLKEPCILRKKINFALVFLPTPVDQEANLRFPIPESLKKQSVSYTAIIFILFLTLRCGLFPG